MNPEGGQVIAVHPDDDSIVLRWEACLHGVRVLTLTSLEPGKLLLVDLDKLMELPEGGFGLL